MTEKPKQVFTQDGMTTSHLRVPRVDLKNGMTTGHLKPTPAPAPVKPTPKST